MTVLHLGFFNFLLPQTLVFLLVCIEDYYSHAASLFTCIKIIVLLFLLMSFVFFPATPDGSSDTL